LLGGIRSFICSTKRREKLVLSLTSSRKTPQILENVLVKDKSIINKPDIKKSIKKAEKLMNGSGRILVRASGTEPKIRVMGESENRKLLEKCLNIILTKLK
jgi:phosphoglucosamine mutase